MSWAHSAPGRVELVAEDVRDVAVAVVVRRVDDLSDFVRGDHLVFEDGLDDLYVSESGCGRDGIDDELLIIGEEEPDDLDVTVLAGDTEESITVDAQGLGSVFDEQLDDIEVSIDAGEHQRDSPLGVEIDVPMFDEE